MSKKYRLVEETLECGEFQYAIEYQSLATYDWLLVTKRKKFDEAHLAIIQLQDEEVVSRRVLQVYSND